jgi:hypothetical protein
VEVELFAKAKRLGSGLAKLPNFTDLQRKSGEPRSRFDRVVFVVGGGAEAFTDVRVWATRRSEEEIGEMMSEVLKQAEAKKRKFTVKISGGGGAGAKGLGVKPLSGGVKPLGGLKSPGGGAADKRRSRTAGSLPPAPEAKGGAGPVGAGLKSPGGSAADRRKSRATSSPAPLAKERAVPGEVPAPPTIVVDDEEEVGEGEAEAGEPREGEEEAGEAGEGEGDEAAVFARTYTDAKGIKFDKDSFMVRWSALADKEAQAVCDGVAVDLDDVMTRWGFGQCPGVDTGECWTGGCTFRKNEEGGKKLAIGCLVRVKGNGAGKFQITARAVEVVCSQAVVRVVGASIARESVA